jgi:hypothetical protein
MITPYSNANLDQIATQQIAVVHPTAQELPKSALGYSTNNSYPGFPPLMNDGRALIASWQHDATLNQSLLQSSGVKSNWEYRKFLTENANDIMRRNFAEAANDTGYYIQERKSESNPSFVPIFSSMSKKHAHPSKYNSYLDPEREFGRFESDLKANYLSREQLQARMATPVITQDQLLRMHK